ncbi:MAG: tRNA (guanosine(46)-N7)-methyltransferase TrmB [Pseudomonadota bacterium]
MVERRTPDRPWRNFYGRRHGKRLRPGQERLLAEMLPRLALQGVSWEENPARRPLDLPTLFGGRAIWLEIGFGGGEHLVHQARANPEVAFIGCEPFVNGIAMCLSALTKSAVRNVRLHPGDARDLLDVLPEGAVSRLFLLYPDPWPKARHHRRRFVNAENADPLARILAPGARFHVATDIPDYARQTLEVLTRHPAFAWTAERPADWRTPWANWTRTRYEAKAVREGRTPIYLTFARR